MSFSKGFGKRALKALQELINASRVLTKGKLSNQEVSKGLQATGADLLGRWKVGNRPRKAKRRFVVLVFIKYTGWYREGEEASEPPSMQLNSVKNDLLKVLDYLRYRHDDKETIWQILTDFDLEYTDETSKRKRLKRVDPTREAILHALDQASLTGGSGLVYFGTHGEYGLPGTSVLDKTRRDGRTQYSVNTTQDSSGPKRTFLLAIDGGRIYAEDILSRLHEDVSVDCVHTLALDTCHGSGMTKSATNLLHVCNGEPVTSHEAAEGSSMLASAEQRSSKQLVIISAAREGEVAGTVDPGLGRLFGTLTWYMIDWLERYPNATAQNLSERLRHVCSKLPKGKEQHPEIWARHRLTGSFELLPGFLDRFEDESRAEELPETNSPPIRWFRVPHLATTSTPRAAVRRTTAH